MAIKITKVDQGRAFFMTQRWVGNALEQNLQCLRISGSLL